MSVEFGWEREVYAFAIALAAVLLILWGWQQGGLALLQLPGLC